MNISSINTEIFDDFIGCVSYFPNVTPPNGWLACDGSNVSRSDYSELFSVIGTTYGYGDGSTTFKIPDFRGEFIRCWSMQAPGTYDSSRSFVGTQYERIKNHGHWISHAPTDDRNLGGTSGNSQRHGLIADAGSYSTTDRNRAAGVYTRNDPGYGTNNETRPVNIALLACIKY
jgi:microcystin-dependent protein